MLVLLMGVMVSWASEGNDKTNSSVFISPKNEMRPLRPTTHPADGALTSGSLENFQRLFDVNPKTISAQLIPQSAPAEHAHTTLPVINRTTGWVDIIINNIKIGRIGPLTAAFIHDVKPGQYDVTFIVEHTHYQYTERVMTISKTEPVTPGNQKASIASDPNYVKPGFDDLAPPKSGNVIPYRLLSPPSPPEPPAEEQPEKQ